MRGLALLLTVVLVSGCAGLPDDGSEADASSGASEGASAEARAAAQGGNVDTAEPLDGTGPSIATLPATGITEFHWASNVSLPSFALEVVIGFGDDNECDVLNGATSGPGGPGPNSIRISEGEDGRAGWGVGSTGSGDAAAHAGPVDTRSETGAGGGGSLHGSGGTLSGTWRITMLARNVEPHELSFFTEPVSLALSIECDGPFSILEANGSALAVLFDQHNLEGGVGAEASPAGSANLQDTVSASVAASRVRAAAGGFGAHAGQVTVDHPGGQEQWSFLPDFPVGVAGERFHALDGASGDYAVTVDHAGIYLDAFWGAIWGLEPGFDLAAGRRAESVIDSPFD